MKKNIILLFLILLILNSIFVIAQTPLPSDKNTENLKKDLITSGIDKALDKEIQVPEGLQLIIKIFFGIERTISISLLIIILSLWLFSFLLFANILKLTPFFKNWTAWPVAMGVTVLIALSGTIKNIALFLLNIGNSFAFLAKLGPGALLFIIILIIIVAVIFNKLLKIVGKKLEKEQAHEEGERIGATIGTVEKMKEMYGFTKKL